MKCTLRENNGITLIALVVTIIVLLILAGVSIAMLVRENGKIYAVGSSDTPSASDQVGTRVSDGSGSVVPVPEGFYYVGGTVNKGAVISDAEADKNRYAGQEIVGTDLVGNQFVFVPANGSSLKYEQNHTYDNVHQYQYTTKKDGYEDLTLWEEDEAELAKNIASIKQHGGFYIGRYEAGYPDINISFRVVLYIK